MTLPMSAHRSLLHVSLVALCAALVTILSAGSARASQPVGSAVKGSGAAVYIVQNYSGTDTKRGVPSWPTFLALGTGGKVTTIPDAELNAIANGPDIPNNAEGLLIEPVPNVGSPVTYAMQGGKKRRIVTDGDVHAMGISARDILALNAASVAAIPDGDPLSNDGRAIKGSSAACYVMQGGKKRAIPSWPTALLLGFGSSVNTIPDASLLFIAAGQPIAEGAEGLAIKGNADQAYLIQGGKKRPFLTPRHMLMANIAPTDVLRLPDANVAGIPDGPVFGRADGEMIKGSGAAIYVMNFAEKHLIPSMPTLMALGTGGKFTTIPDAELAAIPTGAAIPVNAEGLPIKGSAATVYLMQGGKKRPVSNPTEDLRMLHLSDFDVLRLPDAFIAAIPTGTVYKAGSP